jgi:hypothetical protein
VDDALTRRGSLLAVPNAQRGLMKTSWAGRPERVDADAVYLPFLGAGGRVDSTRGADAPLPPPLGDVFVFDYGVLVCWGLLPEQEDTVLNALMDAPGVAMGPLPSGTRERDAFEAAFAPGLAPAGSLTGKGLSSILNGVITLDSRFDGDGLAQLAVSHALAQSTKLSVFESRITRLAEASAHIPTALAAAGEIRMPRREATRLTGQLFLQRSAVNLLSAVNEVPAFFWDAADEYQGVYSTVTKYLEIKSRVAVLNARYQVLEAMLSMVQNQLNDNHASRLEWIIMCASHACSPLSACPPPAAAPLTITRCTLPSQLAHRRRDWARPRGAVPAARERARALRSCAAQRIGAARGGAPCQSVSSLAHVRTCVCVLRCCFAAIHSPRALLSSSPPRSRRLTRTHTRVLYHASHTRTRTRVSSCVDLDVCASAARRSFASARPSWRRAPRCARSCALPRGSHCLLA